MYITLSKAKKIMESHGVDFSAFQRSAGIRSEYKIERIQEWMGL